MFSAFSEQLSRNKNVILTIIGIFLVISAIIFFFIGGNKTWGTATADYFIPPKDIIPGRELSYGSITSVGGDVTECQKTKRVYVYSWPTGPMLPSFCDGYVLEFNTTDDAVSCFYGGIKNLKERNATIESIFVRTQEIKNITYTRPSFIWTKNRFVFSFNYNNLGCDEFRNNIINNITSKYPFF